MIIFRILQCLYQYYCNLSNDRFILTEMQVLFLFILIKMQVLSLHLSLQFRVLTKVLIFYFIIYSDDAVLL